MQKHVIFSLSHTHTHTHTHTRAHTHTHTHTHTGTNMPIAGGSNTFIVVDSCKAKIQTNSRTYFYVEVHSTCFEGAHKSGPNNEAIDPMDGFVRPVWCGRDPILKVRREGGRELDIDVYIYRIVRIISP